MLVKVKRTVKSSLNIGGGKNKNSLYAGGGYYRNTICVTGSGNNFRVRVQAWISRLSVSPVNSHFLKFLGNIDIYIYIDR